VTYPGVITYQGNGLFIGETAGCTYFTVMDAGFMQNILVGVAVDPSTCQTPPGGTTAVSPQTTATPKP